MILYITNKISEAMEGVLKLPKEKINVETPFSDYGIDSLVSVELISSINTLLKTTLRATALFDHINIISLAQFIDSSYKEKISENVQEHSLIQAEKFTPVSALFAPSRNSQRESSFIKETSINNIIGEQGIIDGAHNSLLLSLVKQAGDGTPNITFSLIFTHESMVGLQDHVICQQPLMPADAYIEMLAVAWKYLSSKKEFEVVELHLVNSLVSDEHATHELRLNFTPVEDGYEFGIFSVVTKTWLLHTKGLIRELRDTESSSPGLVIKPLPCILSAESIYDSNHSLVSLGEFYRTIQSITYGEQEAIVHLNCTPRGGNLKNCFITDPSIIDGILVAVLSLARIKANQWQELKDFLFLPISIKSLTLHGSFAEEKYIASVEIKSLSEEEGVFDTFLYGGNKLVMTIKGLCVRKVLKNTVLPGISRQENSVKADANFVQAAMTAKSNIEKEDIAIIGMSGRFPGARNLDEFWNNLAEGKSTITEIPPERWSSTEYYDPDLTQLDKTNSRWGGFLEGVADFSPLFFGISGFEAERMDPQQRLFLEESWSALEDAGYANDRISNARCSVYVGAANGDYQQILQQHSPLRHPQEFWGNSSSVIASRISYFLNLKGAAVAVDTACSSSLVALHLGCQSLLSGESNLVIAGGVFTMLTPTFHILASNAGMLSPNGKCHAFDASANGFVPGEGVGVVILKPLAAALKDRDHIYAVIKGTGINQDGKTYGITVPSTLAQTELEVSVYEKANINPETISYVEAHGTGTSLGDPIEIAGLTDAFRKYTTNKNYCAIGSVKTNIGHTATAAGIASIIKVALAMKHKKIPPSLNFEQPNKHILFEESPFYVNTNLKEWKRTEGQPLLAAVSSFGFSGTNCHVIMEEGPDYELSKPQSKPYYLLTLSAKHADSLKQGIAKLHAYLKKHSAPSLESISYTLNTTRSHFGYRCAMVVSSIEELHEILEQVQQGQNPTNYLIAKDKISKDQEPLFKEILSKLMQDIQSEQIDSDKYRDKLHAMADLYIRGYEPDWTVLHKGEGYQKISLPTYPFLKEQYWVKKKLLKENATQRSVDIPLAEHYLLTTPMQKIGDNYQYNCALSPTTTILLRDHVVFGYPVLPTDSLLELVYTAGLRYFGTVQLDIKHVFILSPVIGLDASLIHLEQMLIPDGEDLRVSLASYADTKKKTVHLEAVVSTSTKERPTITIHQQVDENWETIDLSTLLGEGHPIRLGPFFQSTQSISIKGNKAVGRLVLSNTARTYRKLFHLHPGIMDGALGAAVVLAEKLFPCLSNETYIPTFLEKVVIWEELVDDTYTVVVEAVHLQEEFQRFNVFLLNESNHVVLALYELDQKRVTSHMIEALLEARDKNEKVPELGLSDKKIELKALHLNHPRASVKETSAANGIESLEKKLLTILSSTLCLEEEKLEMDKGFNEQGVDSILAMEVVKVINQEFGLSLKGTILYEHPSVKALAVFLAQTYPSILTNGEKQVQPLLVGSHTSLSVKEASRANGIESLEKKLLTILSSTLCLEEEKLEMDKGFNEQGVDSILAMEVVKVINQEFGLSLKGTILYEHPSVKALAVFLAQTYPSILPNGEKQVRPLLVGSHTSVRLSSPNLVSQPLSLKKLVPLVPTTLPPLSSKEVISPFLSASNEKGPSSFSTDFTDMAQRHVEQVTSKNSENVELSNSAIAITPVSDAVIYEQINLIPQKKCTDKTPQENLAFPLCNIQSAYVIGEQAGLPLSTTAQFYGESEFEAFDKETIQQALRQLIDRHPMLRAIVEDDGAQRILDDVEPYELVFHNVSNLDPARLNDKYDAIRHDMISKSLPLARWPQFDIQVSSDGTYLRLHFRFNLWMMDAMSSQIFYAELLKLCHFPSTSLPPLPAIFRQFVEATQLAQNSLPTECARDYWYQRVPNLPLGPTLPLRCALDEVGKPTFVHLVYALAATTWANFASIAKQNRLTQNSAILAAYATVLARWSKHRHFTITLLVSRRNVSDDTMTGVIGNFGSTFLLEINAKANWTFSQLATSIQKQLWSDTQHMDISGIEVGQEINRVNFTPLGLIAPVTFTSVQPGSEVRGADLQALKKISLVYSHLDVPQVFIDHQILQESKGQVILNWDFVDGLLHADVAKEMFESYTGLLELLAADPGIWEQPIKLPLPLLQQEILKNYNQSESVIRDCTLDALVTEQINAHPDSIAIVNGNKKITYAELGARAEKVRRSLSGANVTPGQLVGVGLSKGWQQVVAVLGILRAGAAYVPIDPELPLLRRKQLIDQAQIDVVITNQALVADWGCANVRLVCIERASKSGRALPEKSTHLSTDVAYVIFTSGSTGIPKGVVIDHRGAVNTLLAVNNRLGTTTNDKVLALSSLSFDLSVFDIFGLLAVGGTIVIPTAEEQKSPEAWKHLITKNRISIWNSVPALFQLLSDSCLQDKTTLPSLRHVMMSGDWIPRRLPDQGKQVAPGALVFSLGGATEASIWSVIHETGPLEPDWHTIPYGRPLANQHLYVLDDGLEVCPIWKTGELYIGGRGVALSYLYDPARTDERFIIHPSTGERLYRTGDMARMRPDGNMEFLGREDHQIKIRGFRIELGEIESFILQQRAVQAAVVKVLGSADSNKRLVAFVVLKPGETLSPQVLNEVLQTLLPRYMVPELIHMLPELPLTSNGKIDHARLEEMCVPPASQQIHQNISESFIEDDLSATLHSVWQEILSQQQMDPDTSFLRLAGHLFRLFSLLQKSEKSFGIKLGFADISSDLSLRKMATMLRQRGQQLDRDIPTLLILREAHQSDPAIFCIHPVGGSAHCYIPFANRVAPGARILGVPALHTTPGSKISIEMLASQYSDLIVQSAQNSEILLVGWSMGAAIVCEIVRFLRARDRQVKFICLLDPYSRVQNDVPISSTEILLAFCDDLAGLAGRRFDRSNHSFAQALHDVKDEQKFELLMEEMLRQSILPPAAPLEELSEIYTIFERNTRALLAYTPTFIDEEVTVFHTGKDACLDGHYLKKWQLNAKKLNEYKCDADHFTIMQEPAISMVADTVSRYLSN